MNKILLLPIILLIAGCSTYNSFVESTTPYFISRSDEIRLGKEVFNGTYKSMQKQGVSRNANSKQVDKIRTMVRRITAVSDEPNFPYEFAIYSTNIVNAMAAPGGKIIIFEGLWDPKKGLVKDDNELAAVIAHEIAHVTSHHSAEAMTSNMILGGSLAVAAAIANSKDADTAANILGGAFVAYEGLLVTKFSRRNEYEADRKGIMYMAKAGYDPRAAVRIWERAVANRSNNGSPLDMISTHPNDASRVQALRKQLPAAMDEYRKTLKK